MPRDSACVDLTHHFLIAMPGIEDETFARSVVYLCEHTAQGALGLIINKPSDINLRSLFDKVDLPLRRPDLSELPVFNGGPLQTDRGFVLHDSMAAPDHPDDGTVYASTLAVRNGIEMTTSKDVLEALASGAGPRRVLVTLGYAAWEEGQLESELIENSWLTVQADPAVIFDTPAELRYAQALALLGIEPTMLSPMAGRA